jgi:putative transposase
VRKGAWEAEHKTLAFYDTVKLLPGWRKADPLMFNFAHAQCLQNAQRRVDLAFRAFFRRVKAGEKPGYPRFKSRDRYDSITYPQVGFRLEKNLLAVSKIGSIKIKLHRRPRGKVRTLTLRRTTTGKWFAFLVCDGDTHPLKKSAESVGIDAGLHSFAYLSNGESIAAPKFFRRGEKVLERAQQKLAPTARGSKERRRRRRVIAQVYERIANRRRNFARQLSRRIVNRFGLIAVEDLDVKQMVLDKRLSKSISDAAWSQFFQQLVYKAEDAGRTVVKVNPAYTSQTCSSCGHRQKLALADRTYVCECCGLKLNRDHNAAINILRLGMQSLASAAKPAS